MCLYWHILFTWRSRPLVDTVILNLIAYSFLAIWSVACATLKYWSKWVRFVLIGISAWSINMCYYLFSDRSEILTSPLNDKLNFYESVTNWLFAWLLLAMFIHGKRKR